MPARILLIEDDLRLAEIVRKLLAREGYEVEIAYRGDDGLRLSQDAEFDVVLTDLKLPGLDGLELIARMHAARPKVPIIMMTAHGTSLADERVSRPRSQSGDELRAAGLGFIRCRPGATLARRLTQRHQGHGAWNWGRYANPKLDLPVEQSLGSVDAAKREALAQEAGALAMRDVALIPLHHQLVSWAMRKNLSYTPRTDEFTFAHHFRQQ